MTGRVEEIRERLAWAEREFYPEMRWEGEEARTEFLENACDDIRYLLAELGRAEKVVEAVRKDLSESWAVTALSAYSVPALAEYDGAKEE